MPTRAVVIAAKHGSSAARAAVLRASVTAEAANAGETAAEENQLSALKLVA
jgi:hypothetical protein